MTQYMIIGNGVAGTTAVEYIRKHDPESSITILSDEDLPFYSRLRLNEVLSGEIQEEDLIAKKVKWYQDRNIDQVLNTRITGADIEAKSIIAGDNRKFNYDRLLIACGSHSFIPPIKGADLNGVFTLRNIGDVRRISSWAKDIRDVVLIGGGLLGLEAGNALRKLGKRVMVVEFFPRLLPRQLDGDGARRLEEIMETMGFSFRLGAKTREIFGGSQVSGISLEDGERLSAEMVIVSAGVRPNMELADPLGLDRDKGIKVDERLQTNQPDIYAAGDVAEFRGMPYGIWPAAMEQGKIAGINMAGEDARYSGTTMANTLKVVGVDLASAGNIDAENQLQNKAVHDARVYKKIVIEGNKVVGCIMLGDTKGFNRVTQAMSEGWDVTKIENLLD